MYLKSGARMCSIRGAEWSDKKAISVLLGMLDVGEDLARMDGVAAATEGRLVSALSSSCSTKSADT